ncbi:hypothetical protein [Myxococcus fulvus]|uniref:hypothetical protein n=1 Tax=Myxococcus fulvus TaxID=33 RepID=UPI0020BDC6BA|nr:hypothetical protein [Myxococcus fulvus]MCK8504236.1 hypothetical protein [Myxococcus fulvus]
MPEAALLATIAAIMANDCLGSRRYVRFTEDQRAEVLKLVVEYATKLWDAKFPADELIARLEQGVGLTVDLVMDGTPRLAADGSGLVN